MCMCMLGVGVVYYYQRVSTTVSQYDTRYVAPAPNTKPSCPRGSDSHPAFRKRACAHVCPARFAELRDTASQKKEYLCYGPSHVDATAGHTNEYQAAPAARHHIPEDCT